MTTFTDRIPALVGRRLWMVGIGALAGLAAWLLVEVVPDVVESARVVLFLSAGAGGFFVALLAAAGTMPFLRAAMAAAVASIPAAGLLTWASFRYTDVKRFLETGIAPVAFCLIVSLSLPYLMVGFRGADRWHSYPALFEQAWEIVVRLAAAMIFTGAFWAVVFLSDALFALVGLHVIDDILAIDVVAPILTGAVIGLALAVVSDLAEYSSPSLILRLLCLLLPVVLVVTFVFLVALPLRGVSDLFGELSGAAVLLSMAVGIATLITSAVERQDDQAVGSGVLRASAQLLALALPVLAGLALYSIWLRVAQYGWSPDRLAATCAAAVGLGYGLLYAGSVAARRRWMAQIRRANTAMALGVIAAAALWLSPVLNAERISARDQLARFAAGDLPAEDLDLWFLGRDLGVVGESVLADLAALDRPDSDVMERRIAALKTASSRYDFEQGRVVVERSSALDDVLAMAKVLPVGAAPLEPADLADVSAAQMAVWARSCARLPDAASSEPGCVALRVDLLPDVPGEEVLFFWRTDAGTRVAASRGDSSRPPFVLGGVGGALPEGTIARLVAGDFQLRTPAFRSLDLGGTEVLLLP